MNIESDIADGWLPQAFVAIAPETGGGTTACAKVVLPAVAVAQTKAWEP
jgi:hypothetical protein